jgi:hypothetical protein
MTNGSSRFGFLSHPFFLLIFASVIGSILIPHYSERATSKKVLQEAQLRKAVDIIDNNTRTISQLNSMVTRVAMFHESNIRLKPPTAKLRELQDKLIEDMDSRYLEFDKLGWWWYRDLNDEAIILKIVPPAGSDSLRKDINAYGDNILKTSNALKEFWHPCVAADYDYKNDNINQIRKGMVQKLNDLFTERNQILGRLVSDFATSN